MCSCTPFGRDATAQKGVWVRSTRREFLLEGERGPRPVLFAVVVVQARKSEDQGQKEWWKHQLEDEEDSFCNTKNTGSKAMPPWREL